MSDELTQEQIEYYERLAGFRLGDTIVVAATRTEPYWTGKAIAFDWPVIVIEHDQKVSRIPAARCKKFHLADFEKLSFSFATDSETGTIYAKDWDEARTKLEAMVPEYAVEAGGWGWVQSLDGSERHVVGLSNWKGAQ